MNNDCLAIQGLLRTGFSPQHTLEKSRESTLVSRTHTHTHPVSEGIVIQVTSALRPLVESVFGQRRAERCPSIPRPLAAVPVCRKEKP